MFTAKKMAACLCFDQNLANYKTMIVAFMKHVDNTVVMLLPRSVAMVTDDLLRASQTLHGCH